MTRIALLIALCSLLLGSASAWASGPVRGGRYVGGVRLDDAIVHIDVTLANDGREFACCSSVWADFHCRSFDTYDALDLDRSQRVDGSVPVDRRGRFHARERDGPIRRRIRGHFVRHGRALVGTVSLFVERSCPSIHSHIRAHLVGRPNASRPGVRSACDPVGVTYSARLDSDEAYLPVEVDTGCTQAREYARQWHASSACRRLAPGGGTCAIPGAICQAIRGGRFKPRASASCSRRGHPRSVVELVHHVPCDPPRGYREFATTWAVNLDCSDVRTFPLDHVLSPDEERGPCGWNVLYLDKPETCPSIGGFTCVVSPAFFGPDEGFLGNCVLDADTFEAFVLSFNPG